MISIKDNKLYQWDTARVIMCTPPDGMHIDEIHVDNHTRKNAIVLDVYEEAGYICANIPDVCLQKPHPLHVYAVMKIDGEENTIESATFTVIPRKKPEDYVYEEEEVLRYSKLEEQINALNNKVDNLDIPEIEVDDSLSEESTNPIQNKVVTKAIKAVEEKVEDVDLSKKFTAVPGQVVRVKAVDEKGNPTEWEATDITTGEENVQSDLSENDENSAAYVKNRTHWIGKKTGVVWEEMTVPSGDTPINIPRGVNIVEGETYTVTFNGTEYVYPDLIYYNADVPYVLGNMAIAGGVEDTGEQFVIMIPPSSISEQLGVYGFIFNSSGAEATISVKGTYPFVHALDEKFLPDSVKSQADYAQNDETASDYIKNRTHYEVTELLVEETSVTVTSNGSAGSVLYDAFDVDLIEGDTYIVTFDGTEYECVAAMHPEIEAVCIGASDASFYDVCYNITKHTPPFLYATHTNMHSLYAEGTHMISIARIALKKLDNKYLDLAWVPEINGEAVIIPEGSYGNSSGNMPLSLDMLTANELIYVYYDGVKYERKVISADNSYYIGNLSLLSEDYPNTGEPFLLITSTTSSVVQTEDGKDHNFIVARPTYRTLPVEYLPEGFEPLPEAVSGINFIEEMDGGLCRMTMSVSAGLTVKQIYDDGTSSECVRIPPYGASAEGYVLQVKDGRPQWVDPATITTGTST